MPTRPEEDARERLSRAYAIIQRAAENGWSQSRTIGELRRSGIRGSNDIFRATINAVFGRRRTGRQENIISNLLQSFEAAAAETTVQNTAKLLVESLYNSQVTLNYDAKVVVAGPDGRSIETTVTRQTQTYLGLTLSGKDAARQHLTGNRRSLLQDIAEASRRWAGYARDFIERAGIPQIVDIPRATILPTGYVSGQF